MVLVMYNVHLDFRGKIYKIKVCIDMCGFHIIVSDILYKIISVTEFLSSVVDD